MATRHVNFKKGWRNNTLDVFSDPTYLGFLLLFDFNHGLLADENSNNESAIRYLESINEPLRANYLKTFRTALRKINNETPWFWQSISGVENMWHFDFSKNKVRGGEDAKVAIECLESIDLRVSNIMNLYKLACYDYENRRVLLPKNLRRFTLTVYVQESRQIRTLDKEIQRKRNKTNGPGPNRETGGTGAPLARPQNQPNPTDVTYESLSKLLFELHKCEFDVMSSGEFLGSLSNADPQQATQKISLIYHGLKEKSEYAHMDIPLESHPISASSSLYKDIENLEQDTDTDKNINERPGGIIRTIGNNVVEELRNRPDELNDIANNVRTRINNFGRSISGNAFAATIADEIQGAVEDATGITQLRNLVFGNYYERNITSTVANTLNRLTSPANVFEGL